jgi:ribosome maturation factor RimP
MDEKEAAQRLREMASPALAATGLELIDVETGRKGSRMMVRMVVDKPGGVGVDDCAELNRYLSDLLDVHDPLKGSYILEVSSPGLDRPLKKPADFAWAVGKEVKLTMKSPDRGKNVYRGLLADFDGTTLTLEENDLKVELPLIDVAKARLDVDPYRRPRGLGQR